MKKIAVFLLLTAFALGLVPAVSAAAEPMTGVCGENMTYTLDMSTKTLTITGTGAMDDFGQSGEFMIHPAGANEWHCYHDRIETIRIGEGVTTVGNQAFYNFSALTCVELPETLTEIGSSAFAGCVKLPEIRLPANLQRLAGHAFYNCECITALTIPAAMTDFNPKAVALCASLAAFDVAEGNPAFAVRDGILFSKEGSVLVCYPQGKAGEAYVVPDGVKEIGDAAFQSAEIRQISLPDGLTKLGDGAFACSGLTEFTLPKTVSTVPEALLGGCAALEKVTLHEGVTAIGPMAFTSCTALAKIDLPVGLQRIGNYAFCFCAALREATLPEGLTELGYNAFSHTAISSATIPAAITVLENGLFSFCTNLSEVKLHDGITSLGSDLFCGCASLEHISLPESVTEIKSTCFAGSGLKEFAFPKGVTRVELNAFENCAALKTVDCPGVERVGMDAFRNCTALEEVSFGSSLKGISSGAFAGCTSLRDVYYDADLAHWRAVSVSPVGADDPLLTATLHTTDGVSTVFPVTAVFADVASDAWYAEAVSYAYTEKLMVGVAANRFAPEDTVTRAMVVTPLWRKEESPIVDKQYGQPFSDLGDAWYTNAALWAISKEIVKGYPIPFTGMPTGVFYYFAPEKNITREELATFLYRYAAAIGMDTSARADLSGFADSGKVSEWAKDALAWCVAVKIIDGMPENGKQVLNPQGTATRAQFAAMLMRFDRMPPVVDAQTGAWETSTGETRNYAIPRINLSGEEIAALNERIRKEFYTDRLDENGAYRGPAVDYVWYVNGDVLTLILREDFDTDYLDYSICSVRISAARVMTADEVLAEAGLDRADFEKQASTVLGNAFCVWLGMYIAQNLDSDEFLLTQFQKTVSKENTEKATPYFGENGALCFCGNVYQIAGADYHEALLPLTGYETSEYYETLLNKLG
ncbi:MAG: leucine-rich repeat protein [Oscillospiraceae bacterium]|nr:leucine-rich repeat protein [Oscillospiraceae bacterium]